MMSDGSKGSKKGEKLTKKEIVRRSRLFILQVQNGNSTALLILLSTLTLIICCINLTINWSAAVLSASRDKTSNSFSDELISNAGNLRKYDFSGSTSSNNGRPQCHLGSIGRLHPSSQADKMFLTSRKLSFLEVPVIDSLLDSNFIENSLVEEEKQLVKKIRYTMRKLESSMNEGWNTSQSKINILPLGDFDYVRRDLPVYKAGFEALGALIQKRPKGGMLYIKNPSQGMLSQQTLLKTREEREKYIITDKYSGLLCLSFNTDHCMNDENFRYIPGDKKVNRIKHLRDVLWSKDKFCRTTQAASKGIRAFLKPDSSVRKMLSSEDVAFSDFEFTFPCWIMPQDHRSVMNFARRNPNEKYIAKPRSLGAGKGIYVLNDYEELLGARKTSNLLQTYLAAPHLIYKENPMTGDRNGFKWDIRSYVLVTSVTPFRGYLYNRGLVRIATSPYDKHAKCGEENKTSCLTNTSINKKTEGAQLKDITWSLHKLKKYVGAQKFDIMFKKMKKVIALAMISAETAFKKKYSADNDEVGGDDFFCENCYQLLGVDILFDEKLEAKVVEVNGEPSLKTTSSGKSHYDITKKSMATDLVKIVYNSKSPLDSNSVEEDLSLNLLRWAKCVDLETSEQESRVDPFLGKDDLQYLLNTFRERKNLGGFRPVYPTADLELSRLLEDYLILQGAKERENEIEDGAHFSGRRLSLHRFMDAMLASDHLSLSNEDS